MEHTPASNPNYFQIASEELESVFKALAREVVLRGMNATNNDGLAFRRVDEKMPYEFTYTLPNQLTKELFFSEGDIAPVDGKIVYYDKHRIDDHRGNDGLMQSIGVAARGQLMNNPNVLVDHFIQIVQRDSTGDTFTGDVDVRYSSFDGKSLSQGLVDAENENTILNAADDYYESVRDLTIEDMEHIRAIIDFIGAHPRQKL